MANPTIEISKKQIVDALVQFSPGELKGISWGCSDRSLLCRRLLRK